MSSKEEPEASGMPVDAGTGAPSSAGVGAGTGGRAGGPARYRVGFSHFLSQVIVVGVAFALALVLVRRWALAPAQGPGVPPVVRDGTVVGTVLAPGLVDHLAPFQAERLRRAVETYFLHTGRCPEDLKAVVDEGLLRDDDLHHPGFAGSWSVSWTGTTCVVHRPVR